MEMHAHLQWKQRMSRSTFEQKILREIGSPLERCRHVEGNARMTLYYRGNKHVGTWQSGVGWTFKSAYK